METNPTIHNFSKYTEQQLIELKEAQSLRMPHAVLMRVAAYYRAEKRDPSVDEVQLLDRLCDHGFASAHRRTQIRELYTNDSAAAATYADMMKKRHELRPDARTPMTLSEAAGIANAYLARAGKNAESREMHLLLDELRSPEQAVPAERTVGSEGSRYFLHVLPRDNKNTAPVPDDVLILFDKGALESDRSYQARIFRFLSDDTILGRCKRLQTVGEDGLLLAMLRICNGWWLDLCRMTVAGVAAPIRALTDRYEGCRIAVVSRDVYRELLAAAEQAGIHAYAFATVAASARVTISDAPKKSFTLDAAFLRSLLLPEQAVAKLPNEADASPALHRTPISRAQCAYLTQPPQASHAAHIGSTVTAVTSAVCTQNSFRTALCTVLSSVLELAAAGGAYDTQRLGIGLSLPQTLAEESLAGRACATVLGLYRAQAELGIPAATYRVSSNLPDEQVHLTVFSTADAPKVTPEHWTAAGSRIFVCMLPITPEGIPDFAAFRRMLIQLAELYRQGAIHSHRVLLWESLTTALQSMQTEELRADVTNTALAAEGELPMAVVIESDYAAKEWVRVGSVVDTPAALPFAAAKEITPPTITSRIWSDKREILLLAREGDASAELLASILSEKGARTTLFYDKEESYPAFSRALLASHVLLLCRNVTLPATDGVAFAAETMTAAGGRVFTLQNATAPAHLSPIAVLEGLSEATLSILAQKGNE